MRLLSLALFFTAALAHAQTTDVQRALEERVLPLIERGLNEGEYVLVEQKCQQALAEHLPSPEWPMYRVEALLALGQKDAALTQCEATTKAHAQWLPALMQQHTVATRYGLKTLAETVLKQVNESAKLKPAKDRTAVELVALGQAALALGAEPKKVIDNYFTPAKRKDVKSAAPFLAAGALALTKADYSLAGTEFQAGLKAHGEATALRYGLALAFAESDREESMKNVERVLETNLHHEGALVLKAQHLLRAEDFAGAEAALSLAIQVNPISPEAWALRSALATLLENDAFLAANHRHEALKSWTQNPAVDHTIGLCLSRAYRFAEGAQHQREALAFDAAFMPARLQLCHDLLRLGQEAEAWKLAEAIRTDDGYNTQAHNIGLLEQEMSHYATQQHNGFLLRMTQRDWEVYGTRVVELLTEAKDVLGKKYGHNFDPQKPVLVEFFPSQQDFAIRTFGALGGQGLLGVCFGTVITMNSPGSLASGRNNWESTLWHEFCHVVTLSATHNRMPRWLSEGISVYEERQRNPAWGMRMTAEYRTMILDDDALTPLGEMSSAFIKAKSGEAVMFAYLESSIAVQWLIETYGWEKFRALLADLATGQRINEAIAKNIAPLDALEPKFANHMMSLARNFSPKADWTKPEPDALDASDPQALANYAKKHPNNLWAAQQITEQLMEAKDWDKAAAAAQHLMDLSPADVSPDGGRWLKAMALHKLAKTAEEAQELRTLADMSGEVSAAFLRLIEIDTAAKHWPGVLLNAQRALALNPFLPGPNEALAAAAAALGQTEAAVRGYQRVLQLQPSNPAQIHFKLASLLQSSDKPKAKRYLLDALVLAPRYREAQQLLVEMQVPLPPKPQSE